MKQILSKIITLSILLCSVFSCTDEVKNKAEAEARFEAGLEAYESNNLPLAYKEFLSAAKDGHSDSQFNVGIMYEQGIGVAKNNKEALFWYKKAAEQGNSNAQFNLGVLYENGLGTKVDFKKANNWYRKASVQGDALAIGNLGMLYLRGDGVSENKVAGVALLLQSAMMDPSPGNQAKQNLAVTQGLNQETVKEAQELSGKMSDPKNMIVVLDQYLKEGK